MNKRKKAWYLSLAVLFIVIYCLIFLWVRIDNPRAVKRQYFQDWRKHYLVAIPHTNQSFVKMTVAGRSRYTTSEALGYGMYLSVVSADHNEHAQADFKRLTNYYLAHRLKNSELMAWRQQIIRRKYRSDQTSASDGDLMIAQALYLASRQWHNERYLQLSKQLANEIMASEVNHQNNTIQLGNWVPKTRVTKYHYYIRTSDCMPYVFDDLYQATGDARWIMVRKGMLHYLKSLSKLHRTGLIPDFARIEGQKVIPAKAKAIATKNDGDYGYNSCRLPWLLAGYQKDGAPQILDKMLRFFKDADYLAAGYHLNGRPLSKSQSASFDAPVFAAVNMNRTSKYSNLYTREQYIFAQKLPTDNYYDATLTVLAMYSNR